MAQTVGLVPIEIGRANEHDLKIVWQAGHISVYPARELRLCCPCAECKDELSGVVRIIASTIPADVHPVRVNLVGHYAIALHWSDGHHTGIYPFDYLRKLCPCESCRPPHRGARGETP